MLEIEPGRFAVGPRDQIRILRHVENGTYHSALFEERAFPGSYDSQTVTRVVCRLTHTAGSPTLDGAKTHVAQMRERFIIDDGQVFLEPIEWNGEPAPMLLVPLKEIPT